MSTNLRLGHSSLTHKLNKQSLLACYNTEIDQQTYQILTYRFGKMGKLAIQNRSFAEWRMNAH